MMKSLGLGTGLNHYYLYTCRAGEGWCYSNFLELDCGGGTMAQEEPSQNHSKAGASRG